MNAETRLRHTVPDAQLPLVLQRIDSLMGLRYQPHQWSDLLRLLRPAASELGFGELNDFIAWLLQADMDDRSMDVLAKHLTIGESYFFREIVIFSILREKVIPALMERKEARGDRHLRVWSAGCSTGEEVYSVAILLDSMLAGTPEWKYSVLGTDINPVAVQRAREGRYRDWSFRDVPLDLHAAYFERTEDGRHEVAASIREKTEFRVLNLVAAPALYPAGFDLVLCRNVLMYFTRDKVNAAVQGFRRSLNEQGWLVPSLTETTLINNPGFEGIRFGDATLYRKQAHVATILSFRSATATTPREAAETDEDARPTGLRNPFAALFGQRGHEGSASLAGAEDAGETSYRRSTETGSGDERQARPDRMAGIAQEAAHDGTPAPLKAPLPPAVAGTAIEESLREGVSGTAIEGSLREGVSGTAIEETLREARRLADGGDGPEALRHARAAIAADKMNPRAHFMLATILRENGETTQAILAFERSLYLDRDFIPAHFSIGMLYAQLGHASRSRRHLGIALTLLEGLDDMDAVLEPGEISARRMAEIIRTILER